MGRLRVAVVGVGHHGVFHCEKYLKIPEVELTAVVDARRERAREVARRFRSQGFDDHRRILGMVDAVSVVVPTVDHFGVAKDFLKRGVHVLLEKPMTATLREADGLIRLAKKSGALLQVGHLERFNPAVLAIRDKITTPVYIESMTLSPFSDRPLDVDVVMDVMIHDIDIILSIVNSDIAWIHAVGVPVVTDKIDIANARIQFKNGCVANVTASRVSRERMRKLRIFQPDAYFSVDHSTHQIIMCKRIPSTRKGGLHEISVEGVPCEKKDPLEEELRNFVHSIRSGAPPAVTGQDGRRALDVAFRILKALRVPLQRRAAATRSSRRH